MKSLFTLIYSAFMPSLALAGGMITGVSVPEGSERFEFFPKNEIRMDIAFDHEFEEFDASGDMSEAWIYCRWTNAGKKEVRLLLKDHDDYHGTLDHPWGLQVRITDQAGKVLTAGAAAIDGWWSSSVVCSQLSQVRPGDAIVLRQGENVVRRVSLDSVLFGLDLGSPAHPKITIGVYTIEVRLGGIVAFKPLHLRNENIVLANQRSQGTPGNAPSSSREPEVRRP